MNKGSIYSAIATLCSQENLSKEQRKQILYLYPKKMPDMGKGYVITHMFMIGGVPSFIHEYEGGFECGQGHKTKMFECLKLIASPVVGRRPSLK